MQPSDASVVSAPAVHPGCPLIYSVAAGLIHSGYVRPPLVELTAAGQKRVLELLNAGAAWIEPPVKP